MTYAHLLKAFNTIVTGKVSILADIYACVASHLGVKSLQ